MKNHHTHIYRLLRCHKVSEKLQKIPLFWLSLIHKLRLLGSQQHLFSNWGTENRLAETNLISIGGDKGCNIFWGSKHTHRGADKSLAQPDWKKQLKGRHFSSDAKVIAAAETWLDGQPSDFFFFEWLAKVRVWSLWRVSFLVGLRTYRHPVNIWNFRVLPWTFTQVLFVRNGLLKNNSYGSRCL